ncbi:MAG: hypothetical protein ACREDE_01860 [Thermoplasmata archaeon]
MSVVLAGLLVIVGLLAGANASGAPALPLADDRGFLGNLSTPALSPGGSGSIAFTLGNPLSLAVGSAVLTFQVYAFNAFPGNATSTVSVSGAPVLSNATSSGSAVTVSVGTLASHGVFRASVAVATSATTPSGAFAVRCALSFVANATDYLLESRGWFTAAVWAAATELPNGSSTLNLSVLGVSGVLPETAINIESSGWSGLLTGVLVAAAVLVGIGAWIYFRRGPASSSGARSADDDHQAPSAFGKSRTSDGD